MQSAMKEVLNLTKECSVMGVKFDDLQLVTAPAWGSQVRTAVR